jgi:signal transduction histidine kinase
MFNSLRARLWLSYALIIGVVLSVIATSLTIYLVRNPAALRQADNHLEIVASLLRRVGNWTDIDQTQYQSTLEQADKNLGARFLIVDPHGNLVADSRSGTEAKPPTAALKKILGQIQLNPYPQFEDGNSRLWIYTVRTLPNGFLLVASNHKPGMTLAQFFRDDYLRPFWRAGLAALLLSLFLAWLVSRWITLPLEKITQVTHLNSSGQYPLIPLEGPEEVQSLVKSFNEMTNKVQASQKSQRDFIANISHDLKTPLTSIQGFAQAIMDGTADTPEAVHHAADVIYGEVSRMYHMLLDLLDLARLDSSSETMMKEKIDLHQMLKTLFSRFSLQAQQNGKVITGVIEPLPKFVGDPERLAQAISNLLDNALKFSPNSGVVILRAWVNEDQIWISVSNSGSGISPEDLPHLFERFFQADKSRSQPRRGSGLGLSIAKGIILAHGGTIIAYNNPSEKSADLHEANELNDGCTFLIKLPLSPNQASLKNKRRTLKDL